VVEWDELVLICWYWQMTSKAKKPDMPIIAGCLRGLTSYLTNFTQSVEEGWLNQ